MDNIFKRHELKFMLTAEKQRLIYEEIAQKVPRDTFGKYLVQSLYFDTSNWDVIRRSIDKPIYKEKMRLRCYNVPGEHDTMYLELKKKYRGIVYKRRISFPAARLKGETPWDITAADDSQIGRELAYYLRVNPVTEKAHISYDRDAFGADENLRITFDSNIRFRTDMLDYSNPKAGLEILDEGLSIMEIKSISSMPLWLSRSLSKFEIFPRSFSKYGVGYKKYILKGGKFDELTQ